MTQQLGGGEGTSQLPGGPHRLGRADTGSRDGAAPWTLGDRRVWGHQPEGGGHVGKKNNPRTNQQELRRKPDRWGGGSEQQLPMVSVLTLWTPACHCRCETKHRTAARPHSSPTAALSAAQGRCQPGCPPRTRPGLGEPSREPGGPSHPHRPGLVPGRQPRGRQVPSWLKGDEERAQKNWA